jgi:hypothetical protein
MTMITRTRGFPLWRNAPAWVLVLKDLACFVTGLTGIGYLIITDSGNYLLIAACLFLTGLPGVSSFLSLILGRTQETTPAELPAPSPPGITGPS